MNPDNPRLRLGMFGIVIVTLFAALFARLWFLQVMTSKELKTQAIANSTRTILEPAPRGRILDRNGIVLVDNRISVVVTVDNAKLPNATTKPQARKAILDRLAAEFTRYLGKPYTSDDIEHRLADPRYLPYLPIPVADDIPKDLELYLAEHHDDFGDAVAVKQATVRDYPLGRTGSHLLGYVGSVTQQELDAHKSSPKTYSVDDEIGKTGAEETYEDYLRGTPGKRVLEVDSKGNTVRVVSDVPPQPGDDVYLSIDANIQAITEQALRDELDAAHGRRNSDGSYNQSPAGAAVILDPNNGQVLAMASFPDYDPAEFSHPISQAQFDADFGDPNKHFPLNNRALQGQYAPGSTFKLISSVAGLRTGAITPQTTVDDTGVFHVPGCSGEQCTFTGSGGAHGYVNLPRALTVSSDPYFYSLGAQFWTQRAQYGDPIQATAMDFGLGAETGIPLPSEQTGYVLTPDTKKALHDKNPQAYPYGDWFTGDNVQMAIGQDVVAVTPLQLANAYSALANGGTLYSPNIASKIVAANNGPVRQTIDPRVLHQVQLPPEVRDPIMQGLTGVVNDKSGTAYGAFLGFPPGWTIGGKTGTAQVTGKTDTALFAGIAPMDHPQYVGVAVLEESGFGATAAAPVIRRVFQSLADPANAPTVGPGGVLSKAAPGAVENANGPRD